MRKFKSTLLDVNLFNALFFSLSGYYVLLILVSNLASNSISRFFTIPTRMLIILSLLYLYQNIPHRKSLSSPAKLFVVFSFLYFIRIGIECIKFSTLYMPETSFLIYFLSFVFIPFCLLERIKFSRSYYQKMFFIIILGGVGVSLMTYYYYGQLIGEVARISQYVSKDENYISPLALSYCAVLGITAGLSFLLTNKVSKMTSIYLILAIFSCFIPFFLGASRGALIAITVPFLLYFLFSLRFTDKIRFVVLSALFLLIVVFSTSYFGTGIFDRMIGLSDAIDQGSSSAIRLEMWRYGFVEQFLNNPIFGNSLQLDSVSHHPHNIFVEVLLSTGIIGFIPFIGFIVFVFRKIIVIIKKRPQYFWLTSVFLIGFMQNMFSGAIWGASWFAMGAAIILGFDVENIKYEK